MKRKSAKYNVFNNDNPLTNNDQIRLQEVQAIEENVSSTNEKLEEKVVEELNYSDIKPIVTTDDED